MNTSINVSLPTLVVLVKCQICGEILQPMNLPTHLLIFHN